MTDETIVAGTTPTEPAAIETPTILGNSDLPVVSKDETVLDAAGAEAKAAAETETKRLLGADPATLNAEELAKRDGLVKEQDAAKAKALADEKAKGVPEKYEIKAPEGVTLDPGRMEKVTAVFKENGLTNAQAQGMVNLFVSQQKAVTDEAAANFKTFLEDSAKETMEALGPNAKSELAYVARIKNYFSPETLEMLNKSGMGNMKPLIMDLAKIGRLISEEKLVDTGKGSASGETDAATKLYPNMNK
jgi:hypothetical protein